MKMPIRYLIEEDPEFYRPINGVLSEDHAATHWELLKSWCLVKDPVIPYIMYHIMENCTLMCQQCWQANPHPDFYESRRFHMIVHQGHIAHVMVPNCSRCLKKLIKVRCRADGCCECIEEYFENEDILLREGCVPVITRW